jgi:hypothetical protein
MIITKRRQPRHIIVLDGKQIVREYSLNDPRNIGECSFTYIENHPYVLMRYQNKEFEVTLVTQVLITRYDEIVEIHKCKRVQYETLT